VTGLFLIKALALAFETIGLFIISAGSGYGYLTSRFYAIFSRYSLSFS
jgi:hypothetical protein